MAHGTLVECMAQLKVVETAEMVGVAPYSVVGVETEMPDTIPGYPYVVHWWEGRVEYFDDPQHRGTIGSATGIEERIYHTAVGVLVGPLADNKLADLEAATRPWADWLRDVYIRHANLKDSNGRFLAHKLALTDAQALQVKTLDGTISYGVRFNLVITTRPQVTRGA